MFLKPPAIARPLQKSIAILTLTALLGCAHPSKPSTSTVTEICQTIAHDAGETEVCGEPRKIVTVGPNLLELLLALDVQPVGHAEYFPFAANTFEEPARQIPYLGERLTGKPKNVGTAHDPSLEAITALNPDLILADSLKNKDEYALLSQIAPTLLFNYSDAERNWQSGLRAIAQILNRTEQAENIITKAEQRFKAVRSDLQPVAESYPDVLMLLSEQLEQSIDIETPTSACGGLVEDLGFQIVIPNSLKNSEQTSATLSLEALPQLNPDWVVIEGYSSDVNLAIEDPVEQQMAGVKAQWERSVIAQSMPASKAERVYFTTTYLCHALLGPIGTDIFLDQLQQQIQPLAEEQN